MFTRWVRETGLAPHAQHDHLEVAAGLEKSGLHRLRHTGLTLLAAKGTNPYKLQKHARHAKLEMTQGYVHLAAEQGGA